MQSSQYIHRVVDLTSQHHCCIHNLSIDEARSRIARGDAEGVRSIDGHFALVAIVGRTVRMARSLGVPMRYFLAKHHDGPVLIVAHRIDEIHAHLLANGLSDQFHPTYTRMVPAHYITELELVGCPDPSPVHRRFFDPARAALPAEPSRIGERYITALKDEIIKHIRRLPADSPIGVCFSGGIDSGAVLLTTYCALLETGSHPGRLKAFTLSVNGDGDDLRQARRFLEPLKLGYLLEPIDTTADALDPNETLRVIEDYKPLDIEAATMLLALTRGIRKRYPDWRYLFDGDGGDENLKDYPIEENPELTIRSVLNNPLLYHEGWGVGSFKHSHTYSGGLSRAYVRNFAVHVSQGFVGFSPFTLPRLIEIAEGIPFIELTDWSHERLYELKGRITAEGIRAVTGLEMPVFPKRRFQHGVAPRETIDARFVLREAAYRRRYHAMYEA
ncbi:MAG: asparagine synthetase B family protein [Phycisphaerae bacterium]|nr:asparagine synthetase B family protein [Phycisphaerae bacterium]